MFDWLLKLLDNSEKQNDDFSNEHLQYLYLKYDNGQKSEFLKEYESQFSLDYWKKTRLNNMISWFKSRNNNLSDKYHSFNESKRTFILIIQIIAKQAIIAVILVILFFILWECVKYYGILNWFTANIPLINGISTNLATYQDFLTTLMQISGIFLGLYFTAISVVISTVYDRVPQSVRSILLEEKVGNSYIKVVALLGAVALIMLILTIFNKSPGIFNLILVSSLGILSILSFIELGKRIFIFFDPIHLITKPYNEIEQLIRLPTINGNNWKNPIDQKYFQERTELELNIYHDILDVTGNKSHLKGDSQRILAVKILEILNSYIKEKSFIPTESNWFSFNPGFSNLLIADAFDYSKIDVASKTKTLVPPERITDNFWFEKKIEIILLNSLKFLFKNKSLPNIIILADNITNTLEEMGKQLAINEALSLYRSLNDVMSSNIFEKDKFKFEDNYSLLVGLIDYYGVWLINILLGLHNTLETITADSFSSFIKDIDWNNEKTIYKHKIPFEVNKQLEYLQKRLLFESKIEEDIITPIWYQNQIAALGMIRFISNVLDELILELEKVYVNQLNNLIENEQYYILGPYIQRGLETCEKFQINSFKTYYENISTLRKVKDIPWPEENWEAYQTKIKDIKSHLLSSLAKIIPEIAQIPQSKDIPDYFGQSYYYIGDECYDSLVNGNESLFTEIFPGFFHSCLLAHDRLLNSKEDISEEDMIILRMDPIINLIEMSSYSIIYSELEEKDYWNFVKNIWDDYISKMDDPESLLNLINDLVEYHPIKFTSRSINNKRELELNNKLREIFGDYENNYPGEKKEKHHKSLIITDLIRYGPMLPKNIRSIFLAKYILDNPKYAKIKLNSQSKKLYERLKIEKEKNELF